MSRQIIMKLVHWSLTGGLLHLVQRGRDWAGSHPAQARTITAEQRTIIQPHGGIAV